MDLFANFNRVACARVALTAIAVSSCLLPAQAQLTPAQKDKLRGLLSLPKVDLGASFHVYTREGFTLEPGNGNDAATEKAAATLRILHTSKPTTPLKQAQFYLDRGEDYLVLGEPKKAAASYVQAEQVCRDGIKTGMKPEQAQYKTTLAAVLRNQRHSEEALQVAQEAAKDAPLAWEPQVEIGNLFQERAEAASSIAKSGDFNFASWKTTPPTPQQLSEIEDDVRSARVAFAKAVSLAEKQEPNPARRDPHVYYAQAASLFFFPVLQYVVQAERQAITSGKPWDGDTSSITRKAFGVATLRDTTRKALQCSGASPYGYGIIVVSDALASQDGKASKETLEWVYGRLRALYEGAGTDAATRRSAINTDAWVHNVANDFASAETLFHKSLALHPKDDLTARGYVLSLVSQQPAKYAEASQFLTTFLATQESPLLRLLLAKSLFLQTKYAEAESVLDAAHTKYPKDLAIGIALAIVRLKQTDNSTAPASLDSTGYLLKDLGGSDFSAAGTLWQNFMETAVVYYGLTDSVELAKDINKPLLEHVPDSEIGKTFQSFAP